MALSILHFTVSSVNFVFIILYSFSDVHLYEHLEPLSKYLQAVYELSCLWNCYLYLFLHLFHGIFVLFSEFRCHKCFPGTKETGK
jgi:hypothetical protein